MYLQNSNGIFRLYTIYLTNVLPYWKRKNRSGRNKEKTMLKNQAFCVKDYQNSQGETVLEAGKIYNYKIHTGAVPDRGRHHWNYPLTVFAPSGGVWLDQETTDNIMRRGYVIEDLFLMYINSGIMDVRVRNDPEGRHEYAYMLTLGDRELLVPEPRYMSEPPEPDILQWGMRELEGICNQLNIELSVKPADSADAVRILGFWDALLQTELSRDPASPFLKMLETSVRNAEKTAVSVKMREKGIDIDAYTRSIYRDYLEHDKLREAAGLWYVKDVNNKAIHSICTSEENARRAANILTQDRGPSEAETGNTFFVQKSGLLLDAVHLNDEIIQVDAIPESTWNIESSHEEQEDDMGC
jgi:hypothetical protein